MVNSLANLSLLSCVVCITEGSSDNNNNDNVSSDHDLDLSLGGGSMPSNMKNNGEHGRFVRDRHFDSIELGFRNTGLISEAKSSQLLSHTAPESYTNHHEVRGYKHIMRHGDPSIHHVMDPPNFNSLNHQVS